MSDLLKNIEDGYRRGWSFTPLAGKKPKNNGWQSAPRESLDQAMAWGRKGNVGLRTGWASGGLLVIDLDVSKPDYDKEKVKALKLPDTVTAVTGGGGYHLFFQFPAGLEKTGENKLGNTSGKIAPAVDTRGDGGQIVFAGCTHPETGRPYSWMAGRSPAEIAVAPLPDNVIQILRGTNENREEGTGKREQGKDKTQEKRYGKRALGDEMARVSAAASGTRNATLNAAAFALGQLVAGGELDEQEATSGLLAAAICCGLPKEEATKTIASGLASGKKEPRKAPEKQDRKKPDRHDTKRDAEDPHAPPPGQATALGDVDPASGRLVLSSKKTLPTAEAYCRQFHGHPSGVRTLQGYAGQLLEWRENRYQAVEPGAIRNRLQPWLHGALQYVWSTGQGAWKLVDFDSNPATVEAALSTITAHVHLPQGREMPMWLANEAELPDPRQVLPCRSMNLHIPTGAVLAATPALFTYNALEFDFDASAPPPVEWLKFLADLWPNDPEAVELLQEWCGYLLTADTSQQKMLLLVGPKRSGKGTIGRVVTELIGRGNVCGPTTESLAETFGLQQLIGKSLALISDARFSGGSNMQPIIERLLCVSGEDVVTIRRMYEEHVTMKLPVRFMFLSNEIPRLHDVAGAMASRFLVLTLRNSFFGKEDPGLTDRLLKELPGILRWALAGWERLHERGRFVQPQSSDEAIQMLADLSSPIGAFLRECCTFGPEEVVSVTNIYQAYRTWCLNDGQERLPSRQGFGRMLVAAAPGLRVRRNHETGRFYEGISLKAGTPILSESSNLSPEGADSAS